MLVADMARREEVYKRPDGRKPSELRKVKVKRNFLKYPQGSVLIEAGNTKIICSATIEDRVPPFLHNTGKGWITAEYAMLPGSTHTRTPRDSVRGRISGRSQEIQRLIGRSLRAAVNLDALGERTITVDCDVIQADGGTRTLAVTGGCIAVYDAIKSLVKSGSVEQSPFNELVAAISVGVVEGTVLVDLCYDEDSIAEVDFNVVMTASGKFVEVQGTAEAVPFTKSRMDSMLNLAKRAIRELIDLQKRILKIA